MAAAAAAAKTVVQDPLSLKRNIYIFLKQNQKEIQGTHEEFFFKAVQKKIIKIGNQVKISHTYTDTDTYTQTPFTY